jgi:hypothetical protein
MKLLILCIAVIAVSHQVAGKPAMMSAESSDAFIDPDTRDATLSEIYGTLLQIISSIGGGLQKTSDSEELYNDADPMALQKFLTNNYFRKCLTPGNSLCYKNIVKPVFLDSSKCKTFMCLDTVSLAQRAVKRGCYNLSIDCSDIAAANNKLIQKYHG